MTGDTMGQCLQCIFDLNQDVKREYKKNDIIFLEGDEVNKVYRIKSGIVKLEKIYENGEAKIIDLVTTDDYLALLTVLKDIEEYPVSAVCLTDVVLSPIDRFDAEDAYQDNLHFKEQCLQCAAHRIGIFQDHTFLSSNTEIEDRVIHTLTHLSKKFGKRSREIIEVTLPISKTELANMIGLRRETLSRKLSKMVENGVLSIEKNKYTIHRHRR